MLKRLTTMSAVALAIVQFTCFAAFGQNNVGANGAANQDDTPAKVDVASPKPAAHVSPDRAAIGVTLKYESGNVYVLTVIPDGAAAKAGIQKGDELRYVSHHRIRSIRDIDDVLNHTKPGTTVDVLIRRDGKYQATSVVLGSFGATFKHNLPETFVPSTNVPSPAVSSAPSQSQRNAAEIQALNQQVEQLKQRVSSLNQQLGQFQAAAPVTNVTPNTIPAPTATGTVSRTASSNSSNDLEDWWYRNQRGEANDNSLQFQ